MISLIFLKIITAGTMIGGSRRDKERDRDSNKRGEADKKSREEAKEKEAIKVLIIYPFFRLYLLLIVVGTESLPRDQDREEEGDQAK